MSDQRGGRAGRGGRGGHHGSPSRPKPLPEPPQPELPPDAMQQIFDAMMEELGASRRDNLPLADGDNLPVRGLAPVTRLAHSTNAWATATFDDVDPGIKGLEDIAGGQLYRQRREAESGHIEQQSSRGGTRGRGQFHRGQSSNRAGHGSSGRGGRNDKSSGSSRPQDSRANHAHHGTAESRSRYLASRHEATYISLLREKGSQKATLPQKKKADECRSRSNGRPRPLPPKNLPRQISPAQNRVLVNSDQFMQIYGAQSRAPAPAPASSSASTTAAQGTGMQSGAGGTVSGLQDSRYARTPLPPPFSRGPSSPPRHSNLGVLRTAQPKQQVAVSSSASSSQRTSNTIVSGKVEGEGAPKKPSALLNSKWASPPKSSGTSPATAGSSSVQQSSVQANTSAPLAQMRSDTSTAGSVNRGLTAPYIAASTEAARAKSAGPQQGPNASATMDIGTAPRETAGPRTDLNPAIPSAHKRWFGVQLRHADVTEVADIQLTRDEPPPRITLTARVGDVDRIKDLITAKTTLTVQEPAKMVRYCRDYEGGEPVYSIIFRLPHEALNFLGLARLGSPGGQNSIPDSPEGSVAENTETGGLQEHGAATDFATQQDPLITNFINNATEADTGNPMLINFDDDEEPDVSQQPLRSAMMDLALLNTPENLDLIFDTINDDEESSFFDRLVSLAEVIDVNSTIDDLLSSNEVMEAATLLASRFFRHSTLFTFLSDEEQAEYIDDVTPEIVKRALEAQNLVPSATRAVYTVDQMLDLRAAETVVPELHFVPTRERVPTVHSYGLSRVPAAVTTSMAWSEFATNNQAAQHDNVATATQGTPAVAGPSSELKAKVSQQSPEQGSVPTNTGDVEAPGKLRSSHIPTISDVDRLGVAFGSLAVNPSAELLREVKLEMDSGILELANAEQTTSPHWSVFLPAETLPESFPEQRSSAPVAPVTILEASTGSTPAERETRKKKGLDALANSKWANATLEPRQRLTPAPAPLHVDPRTPLFESPRGNKMNAFPAPPQGFVHQAQGYPAAIPVQPLVVIHPRMTTVLVPNRATGLMDRVHGFEESQPENNPYSSASMSNLPGGYRGGATSLTGGLFNHSNGNRLPVPRNTTNPSRPPLATRESSNVQAVVQQRLNRSLAGKKEAKSPYYY